MGHRSIYKLKRQFEKHARLKLAKMVTWNSSFSIKKIELVFERNSFSNLFISKNRVLAGIWLI